MSVKCVNILYDGLFCEKYAREIMSCGDLVREYSCEIMSCNSDDDDVIHEYARDIMSCGDLVQ